jgi:hypothetical protein
MILMGLLGLCLVLAAAFLRLGSPERPKGLRHPAERAGAPLRLSARPPSGHERWPPGREGRLPAARGAPAWTW